uniref:BRCT domain-containing protein n=1 Tax=Vitis vinifera TaxID=29760 RepID=F6HDI8_VITVI
MGSLGDSDDEIDDTQPLADISDSETQNFDALSSPSSLSGEKIKDWNADAVQFLQNTVPFDDTVPLEDAFETQLVNLGGETQVLDDPDCTENIRTQLLDGFDDEVVIESDGEGTDRTEVLSDNEGLSDDNSVRSIGVFPVDKENVHNVSACEQDEKGSLLEPHPLIGEQCNAGSVPRGFTSVRAAALRASGLAARAMTLNGTKSGPLKQNDKENKISSIRGQSAVGAEVAPENCFGEYNEGLRNETKCRVSRSTVRKLFTEDTFAEKSRSTNNIHSNDEGTDLSQLLACGNKSAGLSYVDSQEPEEASQANALDFVDRFLQVNMLEFDQEVDHGKTTKTKSITVSSAKGPQSLAKASNRRNTVGQSEIFDWDDNREDEGGGEFFCHRKEELFDHKHHGRISSSEPRKTRQADLKGSQVDEFRNKEEKLKIHHKIMNFVHSEPRLVRPNSKENDKIFQDDNMKIKKNLANELDEELNAESSGGEFEATGADMDVPDMPNVGFDTQMAAEAMEALFYGSSLNNGDVHEACQGNHNSKGLPKRERKNSACTKEDSFQKRAHPLDSGVITRQSKKMKGIGARLSKESSGCARSKNVREQIDVEPVKAKPKRTKSNSQERFASRGSENVGKNPSKVTRKRKAEGTLERSHIDEVEGCHGLATSHSLISVKKRGLQEELGTFTPVACRTRHRMVVNQFERAKIASNDSGEEINNRRKAGPLKDRRKRSKAVDVCKVSGDKERLSTSGSNGSGKLQSDKLSHHEQSDSKLTAISNGGKMDALSCPKQSRTHRNLLGRANSITDLDGPPKPFAGQEAIEPFIPRQTRSKSKARGTFSGFDMKRKIQSSSNASLGLSSLDQNSEGILLKQSLDKPGAGDAMLNRSSVNLNRKKISRDPTGERASKHSEGNSDADPSSPAEGREGNAGLREMCKPSGSVCTTPVNSVTPTNAASPVCMGNEYVKQSCKKNLRTSLLKEINNLTDTGPGPTSAVKDSRRRREISNVRVLFSQHLDDDIIKQQKKILTRLGVSVASSISDATHFITDAFVRTRNMLEAIAYGKPVVTHLWLESCVQARCFIDEKGYILRDAKKEKELGFSMPVSLARACQHPLLQAISQSYFILITPNTKPGKEIIASLVKAVDGQPVERIGRSVLKDGKFPDDLLILSCDEDYAVCEPYLEKGAAVYSSELLLNGIVTQKLEYERHQLFVDNVKRTRSTIWMRKDGNHFLPVTKPK